MGGWPPNCGGAVGAWSSPAYKYDFAETDRLIDESSCYFSCTLMTYTWHVFMERDFLEKSTVVAYVRPVTRMAIYLGAGNYFTLFFSLIVCPFHTPGLTKKSAFCWLVVGEQNDAHT